MNTTENYTTLAENILRVNKFEEIVIPDSLIDLLTFLYTDEEIEIVAQLASGAKSAKAVSKNIHRPVDEVAPILKSLTERVLLWGFDKGVSLYGIIPFYPFFYDAQMLRCDQRRREGDHSEDEYYKEFIRLFKVFLDEFYIWITQQDYAKDYKLFGVPFGRIISVEESIEVSLGVMAYPSDRYSEIVERSKKSLALVSVCTCRHGMELLGKGCGRERNTCSAMGVAAESAIKYGFARRVSKEEFLDAKLRATEQGLVHMMDDTKDPMIVCSCCGCCCEVLSMLKKFSTPNQCTRSNFEAVIDTENCVGCKACAKICPMDAINLIEKKAVIDYGRCIGCGVCVPKCNKNNISLKYREKKSTPADSLPELLLSNYYKSVVSQC
jgi:electron transport complex protein RnfB